MKIIAPSPGESITEIAVSEWLKEDGSAVNKNELIATVESEKATLEVVAEAAGILRITAQAGETVAVGSVIAEIDTAAGSAAAADTSAKADAPAKPAAAPQAVGEKVSLTAPEPGESVKTVTIAEWHKKNGEFVQKNETVASVESEKANLDVTATVSGVLTIEAEAGKEVATNSVIGFITESAAPVNNQPAASAGSPNTVVGHPSPAAAKILAEKNISPSDVTGTGKDGRITKQDAVGSSAVTPAPVAVRQDAPEVSAQESVPGRNVNRAKMSLLRKKIAERLVSVKNETAMLTTFNEVDMSAVMATRSQYKDLFKEKHQIGLGFMSFFSKACAVALMEFPSVNGMIDGEEIVTHSYVDMGIAVSAPKGLMVPVIRNAEQLSLADIERQIAGLAVKARDGKLSISEMSGGTFTITNGGVFGSMLSTPIINPPQSAILGMHNIVKRPVAVNNQVEIRPVMYVALSYDHRIIDGRESVSFLVRVKQLIEDPVRLLLGV